MAKHYPQFILAMQADAFKNYEVSEDVPGLVTEIDRDEFLTTHQGLLAIRQRQHLDHSGGYGQAQAEYQERSNPWQGDRGYRQLLSYRVLGWKTADGIKLSAYRRGGGGGEARLSGKISVGYGGHIDLADVVHVNSVIDLKKTVDLGCARELDEEVEIFDEDDEMITAAQLSDPELLGLILDNSDDVGHLHAGLLEIQWLEEGDRVKANVEDGLEDLEVFTLEELLESDQTESWSRIAACALQMRETELLNGR